MTLPNAPCAPGQGTFAEAERKHASMLRLPTGAARLCAAAAAARPVTCFMMGRNKWRHRPLRWLRCSFRQLRDGLGGAVDAAYPSGPVRAPPPARCAVPASSGSGSTPPRTAGDFACPHWPSVVSRLQLVSNRMSSESRPASLSPNGVSKRPALDHGVLPA
ncbi:MAG: hypothetical protein LQ340_004280, partial [Diploschistes diacapsis]